jgi:thiol-disulfide isomerase/thioredoxin
MNYRSRIALLVLSAAVLVCSSGAAEKPHPAIDQPAPDFHVTTFDGSKLSLADFKGQVLVLNFWATWCGPCVRYASAGGFDRDTMKDILGPLLAESAE